MKHHQICGIMAAIIFNRLIELQGWSIEDSIKEAAKVAMDLMDAIASQPDREMPK